MTDAEAPEATEAVDPFHPTAGQIAQLDSVMAFLTLAEGSPSNAETLRRIRRYFEVITAPWWTLWGRSAEEFQGPSAEFGPPLLPALQWKRPHP